MSSTHAPHSSLVRPPDHRTLRLCPHDDWPMLRLPDPVYLRPKHAQKWVCLAETLDQCIGSQIITDVIAFTATHTAYYVFESGHQLPLLCGCCGQPLVYNDLALTRANIVGRRLEAFTIQDHPFDDGTSVSELVLEFSRRVGESVPTSLAVAIDVLAHLRHPSNCSRLHLGPRAR